MIDLGYDTIREIFDSLELSNELFWFNISVKFLALVFFMLNIWGNFLDNVAKDWGQATLPFNFSKLVYSILIIVILAGFDRFLIVLETIFGGLDGLIDSYNPLQKELLELEPEAAQETDQSWTAKLVQTFAEINNLIKFPYFFVAKILYFLLWIIDNIVYSLFLIERFFVLSVLRIVGPVIFALAIFEKFRDLLFKWIRLYIAFSLLILPFFFVLFITNALYFQVSEEVIRNTPVFVTGLRVVGMLIAIGVSAYLKIRLFKKSTELLYKLFG